MTDAHLNLIKTYHQWLNHDTMDDDLLDELKTIQNHPEEITERFYTSLSFGTGGMRGELGAGTNRMNKYVIRKATLGLAYYIHNQNRNKLNSVVIAYDCRHKSQEFAYEAALTLAQQGIKAYVFQQLRPTPQLSFAVRRLEATAGIVITASHNPPEYNGYKVYGSDGAQLNIENADKVIKFVNEIDDELNIVVKNKQDAIDENLLVFLNEKMDELYTDYVTSLCIQPTVIHQMADELSIVFTPLHGTALLPVKSVLSKAGFKDVHIVEEQAKPDPNFSTVKSPNPEEKEAFALAIEEANKVNADVIIGTDPDADRMGVVVKDKAGRYQVLTGNQTGALLLHYIITQKKEQGQLSPQHTICKTIVTSELGRAIGEAHQLHTIDTLTGFKFIGEKIKQFHDQGDRQFLFGYEESYGYLIGDDVRDKDAVQAVLLCAEMAAHYKARGMNLYEALTELYDQYGYYKEDLISVTLKGKEGVERIQSFMAQLREQPFTSIGGLTVECVEDYEAQTRYLHLEQKEERIQLPVSNVLKYHLENNCWVCVRPSGTEPKLKFYIGVKGETSSKAGDLLKAIYDDLHNSSIRPLKCE